MQSIQLALSSKIRSLSESAFFSYCQDLYDLSLMKKPWLCLRKITFPFQLSILWNWQTCNLPTRLGMSKIRESGPETATVLLHTLEAESSRAHQNHPKHRIAGRMSLLENMSIKIIFKPSTKQSKRIYKRPY